MQTDSSSPQAPVARHTAALVLFSGGQDSTTCLAQALSLYERVETLGFDYGQRHSVEMQVRQQVRERLARDFPQWAPRLGEDHVLSLDVLQQIGGSSLTEDVAFAMQIVTGVCETDYSGYPDCRDDTMKAMQLALNLGLERRLRIETPLMWIDKARTWQMAHDLGGDTLVDLVQRDTHTCYQGTRETLHDWGYGCGTCPACDLRARGWHQWQAQRAQAN
jgi:7-cyano-7-deazaguanine synthase